MRYKFGKLVDRLTSNVVLPQPEHVFAFNVRRNERFMKPLLSVDLHHVDPAWAGRAHFLYFESERYLEFRLVGGRYRFRKAYQLARGRRPVIDRHSVRRAREDAFDEPLDEDVIDAIEEVSLRKKRGFVDLVEVDLSAVAGHGRAVSPATPGPPFEWSDEALATLARADPELLSLAPPTSLLADLEVRGASPDGLMFGGRPWWLHGDDAQNTPVNPAGEPMRFVGQLDPGRIVPDAGGPMFYVFYCPTTSVVTTVQQVA